MFNFLLGELYPRENEVILEVSKHRGGWPALKFLYDADLTSCWILSAMSPEIQEWSHKSRSRINNLYLLTRPILTSLVAVYWYKSESVCMSLYTLAHRVWIWCSLCFRGWILTPFCLLSVGCWGPGHCMQTLFIVGRAGVVWSDGRQWWVSMYSCQSLSLSKTHWH